MSEVRRIEYLPPPADPAIRDNNLSARASYFELYSLGHEDWFFPIFRMREALRPETAGAPSPRNYADGLKLLLSRVDDGVGTALSGLPLSQADVSGPAAF